MSGITYTVQVPSMQPDIIAWRVLDLSGLTQTSRQSYNYMRCSKATVDGNTIDRNTRLVVGSTYLLELHKSNNTVVGRTVFLTNRQFTAKPRATAVQINRRG